MKSENVFSTPLNILKYTLLAGIISTLISAGIGSIILNLGGFILPENQFKVLLTWWIGDMGGALLITSFLLLWITDYKIKWTSAQIFEAIIMFILLVLTSLMIFIEFTFITIKLPFIVERYPFPFLTFPLILLIAFRFGSRETATAILIFYIIALIGIINGSYRMASENPNQSLLNLQIFIIIFFLLKMSVAAAITQQRKLESSLHNKVEQHSTVSRLGLSSLSGKPVSEIMQSSLQLLHKILKVDYSKILKLLPGEKELLLLEGIGWNDGLIGKAKVSADVGSQAGYSLIAKEPVIVADLRKEKRFNGPPLLIEHGVISGMSCIIYGKNKPFGVLGVHTKLKTYFSRDEVDFLQSVANIIALTIERAEYEEEIVSSVKELREEIKERKRIEKILIENEILLKSSETRYKTIFESAGVSIWVQDFSEVKNLVDELKKKGINNFRKYFDENEEIVWQAVSMVKILDVNEQTVKLFKAKTKDELMNSLNKVFLPGTATTFKEELINIAEEKSNMVAETEVKNLEGEKIDILFTIRFPVENKDYNNVLVSMMDITDRKKAEEEIENSLKEKEILIREIHHRVKNNLQIISSLLNLQYSRLPSDKLSDYFITSRNRIKSIAVVHEMLYKNENLSEINFANYILQLSRLIADSYNAENIRINVKSENIFFDIDITIILGLVINEIISNSVKHAFKGVKEGIITIDLEKQEDLYSLSVKDNGIGLPKSFDLNNTNTLGVSLISSLVAQIEGDLEIRNNVGTEFFITFKIKDF